MILPDADIEVLVRLADPERPLAIAYWNGDRWTDALEGTPIRERVIGWCDTEVVEKTLPWNK